MKTVNMMKKQMWHWCSMLMLICLMGFVACDTAYDNDDWDADDDNFIGEQEYYDGFTSTIGMPIGIAMMMTFSPTMNLMKATMAFGTLITIIILTKMNGAT